ncbi:MAG: hypothetical protein A2381_17125 [Bdellovibrionales bacterium RIFOXYB1_FULL_37_110]|nr:MAG: hypothetical protein A2181_08130 [Bdellovibrionales bacterium RIFOXYA1_FULL_38_20]OFZ50119.1 MAG: hypothetical protein A2417_18960 [Bdellovibrionales bacterium RIFOXYC1_FULL_37_79]OFZ60025.1 MAG: hypothetical protein A2381_17125 [Bdellovibrionales bacterium RIFOXYB1_FULL_37_110]OFZ64252.1 MAG: hypothetical protein A2577_12530 [Bdellovibrionales bacterium RIFOXYD1_FULL_36_51]
MNLQCKDNNQLIDTLNSLLTNEIVAIDQYMTHAGMLSEWGYDKICGHLEKRALDEMLHAEKVVKRILFLNGTPVLNKSKKSNIGPDIQQQLINDHISGQETIAACDAAIILANASNDPTTREILEQILTDKIRHINDIESLQVRPNF